MQKKSIQLFVLGVISLFFIAEAGAHVPYLERNDFTVESPYVVRKSIERSIAVYAWLTTDGINPSVDVDVYTFTINEVNTNLYVELIVPVCDGYYENFVPWFAVIGPGLPDPGMPIPFDIPLGYGAIVKINVEPGEERTQFYEPFGGKWYYNGPEFDEPMNTTGEYFVITWDPYELGGDYVLALGKLERFSLTDIIRALIVTPLIRRGLELHIP